MWNQTVAFARLPLAGLLCVLAACGEPTQGVVKLEGATMGTSYSVLVLGDELGARRAELEAGLGEVLAAVDAEMSTWRKDSELSRFNAQESTAAFPVSAHTAAVTRRALEVGHQTRGAYDVTLDPLVQLWGFGSNGERRTTPPTDEEIADARRHVGLDKVTVGGEQLTKVDPKVRVDLSSCAKGHGVDRLSDWLTEFGCANHFVEIGGEVRARGQKGSGAPWRVGIERPSDTPGRSGHLTVPLVDRAIATSGDYRRAFRQDGQRFSHLIDPRTGRPITHGVASVSVIAETCEAADAWATALSILGPEEGLRLAEDSGLATLMLVRTEDGFAEHRTTAFRKYLEQQGLR